jgi:hypothetical protein
MQQDGHRQPFPCSFLLVNREAGRPAGCVITTIHLTLPLCGTLSLGFATWAARQLTRSHSFTALQKKKRCPGH